MSQLFAEDGEPASVLPALRHKPTAKLNREATMHLRQIESAFARMQPRDTALIAAMALKFFGCRLGEYLRVVSMFSASEL